MCNRDHEIQNLLAIQADMFRLAKRDYDLSPKRLALLSGVPEATVGSWANPRQPVAMPLHGFVRLLPYLPDDLASLIVDPAGKHIGTNDPADSCLHDLNQDATSFSATMARATHPASPGGVHVVPTERGELRDISRRMEPKARAVAA